jgi:ribosomal protein L17
MQMIDFRWDEMQGSPATTEALNGGRRLTDKILVAFHHACDLRVVSTAEELLGTLDRLIDLSEAGETHERRKVVETLADANYRLWDLKRGHLPAPAPPTEPEDQEATAFFFEKKKQRTLGRLVSLHPERP